MDILLTQQNEALSEQLLAFRHRLQDDHAFLKVLGVCPPPLLLVVSSHVLISSLLCPQCSVATVTMTVLQDKRYVLYVCVPYIGP